MNRRAMGGEGEERAVAYLIGRGALILRRNYACRGGEIDVIAEHRGRLLFVEVKSRTGSAYGTGAESVTLAKRARISKAALHYLTREGGFERSMRFDVIEVTPKAIRWIPAAFDYVEPSGGA